MNPNLKPVPTIRRPKTAAIAVSRPDPRREPVFETQALGDAMRLTLYVPGVAASGVDIEGRGADLVVTARKERFVRVNFAALHLEHAQHDYELRLRLGTGFDFTAMAAEIAGGVLTITVPKRSSGATAVALKERLAHAA
jgi:HSP20 family molecular chaperone IbpA